MPRDCSSAARFERQHEFATRLALGASRSRIVRQVVAENVIVGLIAAGAGFAMAVWASDFLVGAAAAAGVPRASEIRIGFPAFVAGAILSLACTTVCALTAALAATRAARSPRRVGCPQHDTAARPGACVVHRARSRAVAGAARRRRPPHPQLLRAPAHESWLRGRARPDDAALGAAGPLSGGARVGRSLRPRARARDGAARRRGRVGGGLAARERVRGERWVPHVDHSRGRRLRARWLNCAWSAPTTSARSVSRWSPVDSFDRRDVDGAPCSRRHQCGPGARVLRLGESSRPAADARSRRAAGG